MSVIAAKLGDISHEFIAAGALEISAVKLAMDLSLIRGCSLRRIERDVNRITSLVADIVEITFIEGDPAVQDTCRNFHSVREAEIIDLLIRDWCLLEVQARIAAST